RGALALLQGQHVHQPVFAHHHESARLDHHGASRASPFGSAVSAVRTATLAANPAQAGAEADADARERHDLGATSISHVAHHGVALGHLVQLRQQSLDEIFDFHVLHATTGSGASQIVERATGGPKVGKAPETARST